MPNRHVKHCDESGFWWIWTISTTQPHLQPSQGALASVYYVIGCCFYLLFIHPAFISRCILSHFIVYSKIYGWMAIQIWSLYLHCNWNVTSYHTAIMPNQSINHMTNCLQHTGAVCHLLYNRAGSSKIHYF